MLKSQAQISKNRLDCGNLFIAPSQHIEARNNEMQTTERCIHK